MANVIRFLIRALDLTLSIVAGTFALVCALLIMFEMIERIEKELNAYNQ
jgi:hypothetical protein